MARIRSIKPELRDSRLVASWPIDARYFWVLLLGYLDDSGRGHDMPRRIAGDCFPHDEISPEQIDKWLSMMTSGIDGRPGPVCRYDVNGMRFIHALNWREHQKPNRPTPSRIPRCPTHEPLSEELTESVSESLMQSAVNGAGERRSRGAGERASGGRSESLPSNAHEATQIVIDATRCQPYLAAEAVLAIHHERKPRNLPALVHTLINAGEIGAWLQKAQTRIDREAAALNSAVAKRGRADIVDEQIPEEEPP